MAAVGCTDRAKTSRALPPVPLAFMLQALPRLGWHASRLPCKPWEQVRCTNLARRAAVGAMPLKYHGGRGSCPWGATTRRAVRGAQGRPKTRKPRAEFTRPVQRSPFKFCGVIDACHPSAAALERSPPGYRARWTHVWFMRGTTQSTAAVLPWVQGRCPWSFFPPISSGRNGGARRVGAFPGEAPGNRAARQGCRALQTAAMYGGPTD